MSRGTIYYSSGCKFCRWVARTIVPWVLPEVNIIPLRHPNAIRVYMLSDMLWYQWIAKWHYASRGGDNYIWFRNPRIEFQMIKVEQGVSLMHIPDKWLVWLDQWVKHHRHILSHLVPTGPAIMRVDGVVTWLNRDAEPIENAEDHPYRVVEKEE